MSQSRQKSAGNYTSEHIFILALRKTDRYFERARESYGRNWKKLITEEFWNNYLEINKDE